MREITKNENKWNIRKCAHISINPVELQGILFKGNKQVTDSNVSIGGKDIYIILKIYDGFRNMHWRKSDFRYTYR